MKKRAPRDQYVQTDSQGAKVLDLKDEHAPYEKQLSVISQELATILHQKMVDREEELVRSVREFVLSTEWSQITRFAKNYEAKQFHEQSCSNSYLSHTDFLRF